MRIYKEFRFEAAHFLPSADPGSPNARVHGHSFRARVTVEGTPDPDTGYIFHFDALGEAMQEARETLDHRLLNEIEIARDSCQEGCIYAGPPPLRHAAE